jgi:hypothetical protein
MNEKRIDVNLWVLIGSVVVTLSVIGMLVVFFMLK